MDPLTLKLSVDGLRGLLALKQARTEIALLRAENAAQAERIERLEQQLNRLADLEFGVRP